MPAFGNFTTQNMQPSPFLEPGVARTLPAEILGIQLYGRLRATRGNAPPLSSQSFSLAALAHAHCQSQEKSIRYT